jgi:hypothetical protein
LFSGLLISGMLYFIQKPESELGWALFGVALIVFLLGIKKN